MSKLALIAITSTFLIVAAPLLAAASADTSVGVKKGDWIDYKVVSTGHLVNHETQWGRLEVVDVDGPVITFNVTTLFNNGTYWYEPNIILNLQTGHLGDDFVIPANLSTGEVFYDARIGNVTITSSEQKIYVGAVRTVLFGTVTTANSETTTFQWDKQTGIMVQAYTINTEYNFTMATITNATNMWQPQPSLVSTSFYLLIIAIVIVIIAVAVVLVWLEKVHAKK